MYAHVHTKFLAVYKTFKCEMLDLDDMSKTGLQTGFPGAFRFLRDAAGAVSETGWKAGAGPAGFLGPISASLRTY